MKLPVRWTLRSLCMVGCMFAAACDRGEEPASGPIPDRRPGAVPVPEMARTGSCVNDAFGLRIEYPANWRTNEAGLLPACSIFHPEPIQLVRGQRVPNTMAVVIERDTLPYDEATRSSAGETWLARERATVAGRTAERSEIIPGGDGMMSQGARVYRYYVDLGDVTMVARTHDDGEPAFEQKRRVLDAMMLRARPVGAAGETGGGAAGRP